MIVSINQPAYLPWLGYFHRIAVSDVHIVLDHVQFEKNSFTNRNKVRTKAGSCWLTVPVATKGRFGKLAINCLEIADDPRWAAKHWGTIRSSYGRSAFFAEYEAYFERVYQQEWNLLKNLLREVTSYLLSAMGIKTQILFSSEIAVSGQKDELVLNLCRAVGATTYLSGALGKNYIREPRFTEAGIKVVYQDYRHPVYPQSFPGFEPYMAAVDLLFNHGPESLVILMKDQEKLQP